MAAHTNPNLTKQPDQHQTRKDKEMQKKKEKWTARTKPKLTINITYPNKNIPPKKTPKPTIQNNLPEQNGAQKYI